jgi:hypothetical protein
MKQRMQGRRSAQKATVVLSEDFVEIAAGADRDGADSGAAADFPRINTLRRAQRRHR